MLYNISCPIKLDSSQYGMHKIEMGCTFWCMVGYGDMDKKQDPRKVYVHPVFPYV